MRHVSKHAVSLRPNRRADLVGTERRSEPEAWTGSRRSPTVLTHQTRMSISGSSVVGYAFAGKHSWPPSWVGAKRSLNVISGSITSTAASRQSLYLRTGAIWLSHFAPVPGINALAVHPNCGGFFCHLNCPVCEFPGPADAQGQTLVTHRRNARGQTLVIDHLSGGVQRSVDVRGQMSGDRPWSPECAGTDPGHRNARGQTRVAPQSRTFRALPRPANKYCSLYGLALPEEPGKDSRGPM